jgi:hypothetical protein
MVVSRWCFAEERRGKTVAWIVIRVVQRVYDVVPMPATKRRNRGILIAGLYDVKNRPQISTLLLIALIGCTASHAAPKRPWRIEVKTDGGFAGRGIGTYALGSDAKASAVLMNGSSCTFTLSSDELARFEAILGKARPDRWAESYVTENTCCDRILYDLAFTEADDVRTTRWIDAPLPMPADLVAVASAIIGGDATSLRMMATERCK